MRLDLDREGRPIAGLTDQDPTAQKSTLSALGVSLEKTFTDQGLTGTNRARPGLREALAAYRARAILVVTKLDRLAQSLRDAKDIVDDLTQREVGLSIGGSVHDPTDPVGRLLFNVLAMVAEFEADLIRARTREGMQVAKAAGRLRGKQPKPSKAQENHLIEVHQRGEHITAQIAELFSVGRSTVYRTNQRAGDTAARKCVVRRNRSNRVFCAVEGVKDNDHARSHNPENTMTVAQTTSVDETILRWLTPLAAALYKPQKPLVVRIIRCAR